MGAANPILDRLYSMKGGPQACRDIYADWAGDYDRDTVGFGYVGPAVAADKLASMVDGAAEVLDAGCGTGLAGVELAARGVRTIDGLDVSSDMLDVARGKGVYRDLATADMTARLGVADDRYDGVICVGVFTNGHVGPAAFDELVRVTKPGGMIVATVHENVWATEGYARRLEALAHRGAVRIREAAVAPYHEKEGYKCRLCVLEAV